MSWLPANMASISLLVGGIGIMNIMLVALLVSAAVGICFGFHAARKAASLRLALRSMTR